MNNVVPFPTNPRPLRHVGAKFLAEPPPHSHAVQFYDDDAFLLETVAEFLNAGLKADERVLLIATTCHGQGILRRLDAGLVDEALRTRRMTLVDAHELLTEIVIEGLPDPVLFRDALERILARMPETVGLPTRVRAFGEMVDVLWRGGNPRGAIALEELWCGAIAEHDVALLCAYLMGNFYREDDTQQFHTLCRQHSHVMPTESLACLAEPEALLHETSLLQQRARLVESEMHYRREIESALRDALRERGRAESELASSLERERQARAQAEGRDDIRDWLTDSLRHQLEGPLGRIVEAARSIATDTPALGSEAQKTLEQIVADGMHTQVMLGQLLDVARDRLGASIALTREAPQDLAALIERVAERYRSAQPGCTIQVEAEASCMVAVDPVRMEQVLATLLHNALTHGDPARPIRVGASLQRGLVLVSVSNDGTPIDPALMPVLFDPFQHPRGSLTCSAGLGVGLYLAERIVNAHGGALDVASSDAGTQFNVRLPAAPCWIPKTSP